MSLTFKQRGTIPEINLKKQNLAITCITAWIADITCHRTRNKTSLDNNEAIIEMKFEICVVSITSEC